MNTSSLAWLVALAGIACSSDVIGGDAPSEASDATMPADTAFDANDLGTEADTPVPVDASPCGDASCGTGEICIQGECGGCCAVPPHCIAIPTGCAGTLSCGCFTTNPCQCTICASVGSDGIHCEQCSCMCAAAWTPIDTPDGPRRIDSLRAGDMVYSVDHGAVVAVPLARVGHRAVGHHAVVRVLLASGAVIEVSGTHPTADGRTLNALQPGDWLGLARVVAVETVPYDEPFTYDILPASDTGTYFAAGAWIGSTMFESH